MAMAMMMTMMMMVMMGKEKQKEKKNEHRSLYTLTASKVSTWAVLATRPMETSFRQECFQEPSVLSAQAAGSEFPPGPRSQKIQFFSKVLGLAC